MAAHEGGDYAKALLEFSPLANQGEAAAQFALGVMYANGQGVAKDDQAAVAWYRKPPSRAMPTRSTTWA